MNNDKQIIWQKWVDPFGNDDPITEIQDEPLFNNEEEDIDSSYNDNSSINENSIGKQISQYQTPIKVVSTPMGIIPMNENTASGKIFNFWVGHTNFNITKKIASTIENIDGVETLDIFTRYRFRIAIGKAFNDSYVMRNINTIVYESLNDVT